MTAVNLRFNINDEHLLLAADKIIGTSVYYWDAQVEKTKVRKIENRSDAIRELMRKGIRSNLNPLEQLVETLIERVTSVEKIGVQNFGILAAYLMKIDNESYKLGMSHAKNTNEIRAERRRISGEFDSKVEGKVDE